MDNDIRVVTDKEVYLLASPAVSKSETETIFRTWLRTRGTVKPELLDAINIVSVTDLLLPMSVTSVDSWGNWSLLQGSFQKRAFDRDQRQYERDYLAYQQEEKKQQAARERGETYPLPPLPRSPNRDDYFEYFPESGEYTTSFKGILRGFGEEALGQAKPYLNDIAIALDNLLRSRFPAAEAAVTPPAPINRDVLNTLVDEYVSDRGIDWVKEQAKNYDTAKKLEISAVNYRRECNIVFLPVRVIAYDLNGKGYVAVSDPIRNEYFIGNPPVIAPAAPATPARPVQAAPAKAPAKMNLGLIGGGAAAAVVVIVGGIMLMSHSGKHPAPATVQAPTSNAPAAAATAAQDTAAQQAAAQAAAQLAAAQAAQKAAQEAADKVAAQAAQQLAAQQAQQAAAIEQAAKQAAAAQAAQDAAAVEAAQEAAAAQAAEQAATSHAAQLAAAAQAQKDAAQQAAAQQAAQEAAQEAVAKQQAAQEAQQAADQQAAAAKVAQQKAQEAAAAQAAEEEAAAQAAAAIENAKAAKLAAKSKTPPVAPPGGKTVVASNAAPVTADSLTAEANASPGQPSASAAPAAPPAASAPPATKTTAKAAPAPVESPAAAQTAEQKQKAAVQSSGGNDLTYYNLGVAAQRAGDFASARTYYQLSMQHSQTDSPPSTCSPRHQASYQPAQCHGVVLPGRAARALASLPAS